MRREKCRRTQVGGGFSAKRRGKTPMKEQTPVRETLVKYHQGKFTSHGNELLLSRGADEVLSLQ